MPASIRRAMENGRYVEEGSEWRRAIIDRLVNCQKVQPLHFALRLSPVTKDGYGLICSQLGK